MAYKGLTLQQAANKVIKDKLPALGGSGGIVALDKNGNVSMAFNTAGMFRGFKKENDTARTFIYQDE